MGRGKVQLKRIENKINREVTFSKRRNGMFKKAYELSILCDAEVALIIFSNKGKLYEFCSTSSMGKTLERFHKSSYGQLGPRHSTNNGQNNFEEYSKLKARVEVLQKSQRHMQGEDIGQLRTNELDQLERVLDTSLKKIRSKKTQHMFDQLSDLQQKESDLMDVNKALRVKLEGINAAAHHSTWQQGVQIVHDQPPTVQHCAFFEPLDRRNTTQIRYNSLAPNIVEPSTQDSNGMLPVGRFDS